MKYYAVLCTNQHLFSPKSHPITQQSSYSSCFINPNNVFEEKEEVCEKIVTNKSLDILVKRLAELDYLL